MIDNSKQLNEAFLNYKPTVYEKFLVLLSDYNLLPDDLRFWFNHKDIFHPSRIWRKLANVTRWITVLWEDVDWDYSALYILIETKLSYMIEHQKKHSNHTDFEVTAQQMQTAKDCLERIRTDDYIWPKWEAYEIKFPRKPASEWEKTPEGHSIMPPMTEEQRVEFLALRDEEERLKQADYVEFSRQFTENSRGWWD